MGTSPIHVIQRLVWISLQKRLRLKMVSESSYNCGTQLDKKSLGQYVVINYHFGLIVTPHFSLSIIFCRSITRSYYRNSVGALLLYDVGKRASFEHLVDWLFEVRRHIEPSKAVYQVVACKSDLVKDREISYEEGKAFADFYNIKFVETSAKSKENIDLAFKTIAEDIYDKIVSGEFQVEDGWEGVRPGQSMTTSLSASINGGQARGHKLRPRRRSGNLRESRRSTCC